MKYILSIIIAVVFLSGLFLFDRNVEVFGGANPGTAGVVATSSTPTVGPNGITTIFASNEVCKSRIITTRSNPIMIAFNSNITASATVGHQQSASTTVVYGAEDFGCGNVTVYGYTASTSITISETR